MNGEGEYPDMQTTHLTRKPLSWMLGGGNSPEHDPGGAVTYPLWLRDNSEARFMHSIYRYLYYPFTVVHEPRSQGNNHEAVYISQSPATSSTKQTRNQRNNPLNLRLHPPSPVATELYHHNKSRNNRRDSHAESHAKRDLIRPRQASVRCNHVSKPHHHAHWQRRN